MTKETRPSSYPLRLPAELREKLESSAKKNNRPLSSEILMRLEFTFDEGAMARTDEELAAVQKLTDKNAAKLAELEQIVKAMIKRTGISE